MLDFLKIKHRRKKIYICTLSVASLNFQMKQITRMNQYKFVKMTVYFGFSTHNIPSFRACSQILASLSSYQYTRKAWRKEAFELLLDSGFFQMDEVCVAFWRTILDNLMTHDKTTFKDLLGKEFIDYYA